MLSAKDIGGLMAMMPAFATDDAADIRATNTVDVDKLHKGVDRMIRDGANVMAAAGSFGEFHTLLPDEFEVLANETVAAAKKRVPVFVRFAEEPKIGNAAWSDSSHSAACSGPALTSIAIVPSRELPSSVLVSRWRSIGCAGSYGAITPSGSS